MKIEPMGSCAGLAQVCTAIVRSESKFSVQKHHPCGSEWAGANPRATIGQAQVIVDR